ncbi:LITAF domain-containing protein [Aphelenchoides fujianensis]|nr:LITAF domain-containing protein [Aphelenchoides fujianensis]
MGPSGPPPSAHAHPPHQHAHQVNAQTGSFGWPFPVSMSCPYCNKFIVTNCAMVAGTLPWILLAICFVLGFFLVIPWCLCCVPFCIDSCQDVVHSCPSCKRMVGRFTRLG